MMTHTRAPMPLLHGGLRPCTIAAALALSAGSASGQLLGSLEFVDASTGVPLTTVDPFQTFTVNVRATGDALQQPIIGGSNAISVTGDGTFAGFGNPNGFAPEGFTIDETSGGLPRVSWNDFDSFFFMSTLMSGDVVYSFDVAAGAPGGVITIEMVDAMNVGVGSLQYAVPFPDGSGGFFGFPANYANVTLPVDSVTVGSGPSGPFVGDVQLVGPPAMKVEPGDTFTVQVVGSGDALLTFVEGNNLITVTGDATFAGFNNTNGFDPTTGFVTNGNEITWSTDFASFEFLESGDVLYTFDVTAGPTVGDTINISIADGPGTPGGLQYGVVGGSPITYETLSFGTTSVEIVEQVFDGSLTLSSPLVVDEGGVFTVEVIAAGDGQEAIVSGDNQIVVSGSGASLVSINNPLNLPNFSVNGNEVTWGVDLASGISIPSGSVVYSFDVLAGSVGNPIDIQILDGPTNPDGPLQFSQTGTPLVPFEYDIVDLDTVGVTTAVPIITSADFTYRDGFTVSGDPEINRLITVFAGNTTKDLAAYNIQLIARNGVFESDDLPTTGDQQQTSRDFDITAELPIDAMPFGSVLEVTGEIFGLPDAPSTGPNTFAFLFRLDVTEAFDLQPARTYYEGGIVVSLEPGTDPDVPWLSFVEEISVDPFFVSVPFDIVGVNPFGPGPVTIPGLRQPSAFLPVDPLEQVKSTGGGLRVSPVSESVSVGSGFPTPAESPLQSFVGEPVLFEVSTETAAQLAEPRIDQLRFDLVASLGGQAAALDFSALYERFYNDGASPLGQSVDNGVTASADILGVSADIGAFEIPPRFNDSVVGRAAVIPDEIGSLFYLADEFTDAVGNTTTSSLLGDSVDFDPLLTDTPADEIVQVLPSAPKLIIEADASTYTVGDDITLTVTLDLSDYLTLDANGLRYDTFVEASGIQLASNEQPATIVTLGAVDSTDDGDNDLIVPLGTVTMQAGSPGEFYVVPVDVAGNSVVSLTDSTSRFTLVFNGRTFAADFDVVTIQGGAP